MTGETVPSDTILLECLDLANNKPTLILLT